LKLSWHQTVGVHAASVCMTRRSPFFLFDAVGIGKTPQSAGTVLMRPWLRSFFDSNKKLPPAFGELARSLSGKADCNTALGQDGSHCVSDNGSLRTVAPIIPLTLYGRKIGTVIVDEAHNFRNSNKIGKALKALASQAEFVMLLTATP
ncbi:hypothetical protein BDY19DRAFT_856640, partial [Irpex rosettiformis]